MKLNVFFIYFVASTFAMAEEPLKYAPLKTVQASEVQQAAESVNRTIAICHLMENPPTPPGTAVNSISPIGSLKFYFKLQEHQVVEDASKVTVLQNPAHGTLKDVGSESYRYYPAPGYIGQDSATLLVEMGGYKIKVIYSFHVLPGPIGDDTLDYERLCPNEVHRISATSINIDDNGS